MAQAVTRQLAPAATALPMMSLTRADDLLVEGEDIGLARADALLLGQEAEGIHDRGDVDTCGTLAGTGVTGDADPDGLTLQSCLQPAVLQEPEHGKLLSWQANAHLAPHLHFGRPCPIAISEIL
jgi:hypothetical protein